MNPLAPGSPLGSPAAAKKPVLVLGLGNDILCDDAVGLRIARELRAPLAQSGGFEIHEVCEMGLSLLDYIEGFDDLVLIDAVRTGRAPPGFLHDWAGDQLKVLPRRAPHALGISEVVALGRQLGLTVPTHVRVLAVEVQDPFTVSTEMTPALNQALPHLVRQILERLNGIGLPG